MKATQSFTVRPALPDEPRGLARLAMNLRWSWDRRTRDLFALGRPRRRGRRSGATRSATLGLVEPRPPGRAGRRPAFLAVLRRGRARASTRYLERPPLVPGQRLTAGSRCAASPTSPPSSASPRRSRSTRAASACWPATTSRRPPTSACRWSASACSTATATSASRCRSTAGSRSATPTSTPGRWRCSLCDGRRSPSTWPASARGPDLAGRRGPGAALPARHRRRRERPPHLRTITDRLYGGDTEHRLRQEILLGVGGVRALRGAGRATTQVFHTNEGHAGFLGLERIREPHRRRRPQLRRGHRGGPGRAASSPPTRRCPPASTASPAS